MQQRTEPHFFLVDLDPGSGLKITVEGLTPVSRSSAALDMTTVSAGPVPEAAGHEMWTVVHDDLRQVVEATGATGVRFHAAPEPSPALQEIHPGYWYHLEVTGTSPGVSRGFHDDHVSFERMPGGMLSLVHPCMDPSPQGWDGSDVYMPAGTRLIVVTEPVARAIQDAGCSVELVEVGRARTPGGMDVVMELSDRLGEEEASRILEQMTPEDLWEQRTGRDRETWEGPGYCPDVVR
ncbi:hypothetical protein [Kytococcus schroeteri]|uniref:Uncharacterized protein n=1 Tax=Kytococcus schroeteri TaxID=138300 RepID=A0A2I1PBE5_9MICO|nr:hypothetical protein [Kytococcus schroeteri]PKZ41942.1 hypothetical protein CYJ76_04595 [Kytococcus schroeteri]